MPTAEQSLTMKESIIKKLSYVYNELKEMEFERLAGIIKEAIIAETQRNVGKSKFDIWKYIAGEKDYPAQLRGIYHKDGIKVATDAHIMVAINDDYSEELEGKTMKPDGTFIDFPYPDYMSIIPKGDGYTAYRIDADKFREFVSKQRADYKAESGKGTKWSPYWFVKVGPSYFNARFFDLLIPAMNEIGTDELMVHSDGRKAAYAKTEKGIALLMPRMYQDGEWDRVCDLA